MAGCEGNWFCARLGDDMSDGPSTIPIDNDDLMKLTRLSFAWECTPEQALKKAVQEALDRNENRAGVDEMTYTKDAVEYVNLIGEWCKRHNLNGSGLIELKKFTQANERMAWEVHDYAARQNLVGTPLGDLLFLLPEIWNAVLYSPSVSSEDHTYLQERLAGLKEMLAP